MTTATLRNRLEHLIALGRLLERVDADPTLVGAAQYRDLSRMVLALLSEDLPSDALHAILGAFPACAVLYENLHYERSGLSQSPLELSMAAEMQAAELIERSRSRRGA